MEGESGFYGSAARRLHRVVRRFAERNLRDSAMSQKNSRVWFMIVASFVAGLIATAALPDRPLLTIGTDKVTETTATDDDGTTRAPTDTVDPHRVTCLKVQPHE